MTTIYETSTARFSCSFVDETGAAIAAGDITSILATFVAYSGTVINARDRQEVLNAAGGVLALDGTFALTLGPSDTVVEPSGVTLQARRLVLEVFYGAGLKLVHVEEVAVHSVAEIA